MYTEVEPKRWHAGSIRQWLTISLVAKVARDIAEVQAEKRAVQAGLTAATVELQAERQRCEHVEAENEIVEDRLKAGQKRNEEAEKQLRGELEEERKRTAERMQDIQDLQAVVTKAEHR